MKVRLVGINTAFWVEVLKRGVNSIAIAQNALPPDAKCVAAYIDPMILHSVILHVTSDEFDDVADGEVIPEHPAVLFTKKEPQ